LVGGQFPGVDDEPARRPGGGPGQRRAGRPDPGQAAGSGWTGAGERNPGRAVGPLTHRPVRLPGLAARLLDAQHPLQVQAGRRPDPDAPGGQRRSRRTRKATGAPPSGGAPVVRINSGGVIPPFWR
jgi:hypothetical protein